jgi:hypothetical protein
MSLRTPPGPRACHRPLLTGGCVEMKVVNLDIQITHQMRQVQRKSARAQERKMARIRKDLDELQRTKRLDVEDVRARECAMEET